MAMDDSTRREDRRASATMLLVGLVVVGMLAPAASARAHGVTATITPPPGPVVEDSGFAIVFSGDVTSLGAGGGYIQARIRPAGGPPCAPNQGDDPGDRVDFGGALADSIDGPFRSTGSYVADDPRDYVICAWVLDGLGESGPPSTARVTVRPPALRITATAPSNVRRGVPFAVAVAYLAEVPRYLSIVVVRATNCSISADALLGISAAPAILVDGKEVSGIGALTAGVRAEEEGTYLVCGFLDENIYGVAAAQLVQQLATVTVARPAATFRACGDVGGRRHIRNVRARSVSCRNAKALARRWGQRARAPRTLGSYRCRASSGIVTCTAGSRQVRFRFGRR
jgi:hypothetical protein